jgi:hypothetical protein
MEREHGRRAVPTVWLVPGVVIHPAIGVSPKADIWKNAKLKISASNLEH